MNPLVECAGKRRLCDHDVEARETVNSREQVPVCREEAVFVGVMIAHCYNDMAPRSSWRIRQKSPP